MKSSRHLPTLLIAGAFACLPLSAAMAQDAAPPAQQPQQKGATFESLDTDKDGRISKSEAAADQGVSAQFSHYDQNGDGYIERAEVTSANHPPAENSGQQ